MTEIFLFLWTLLSLSDHKVLESKLMIIDNDAEIAKKNVGHIEQFDLKMGQVWKYDNIYWIGQIAFLGGNYWSVKQI